LKNLIWSSSVPVDDFFPRCYNLTDLSEVEEFKEDFRANRAECILRKYVKKKECNQVEKLLIAIHVNEKRLKDIDDVIDDPDLSNLVPEDEWAAIEKEKWLDKAQHD